MTLSEGTKGKLSQADVADTVIPFSSDLWSWATVRPTKESAGTLKTKYVGLNRPRYCRGHVFFAGVPSENESNLSLSLFQILRDRRRSVPMS